MSKWRNQFEASVSKSMIKDAIKEANTLNFKKKVDVALSGVAKGKYKRVGGKR